MISLNLPRLFLLGMIICCGCADEAEETIRLARRVETPAAVVSATSDSDRWTELSRLQVWTSTRTVKIQPGSQPTANVSVKMAAARNEWESFQILLQSPVGARAIRLRAGDLAGPAANVIRSTDARLYRQHLIRVTKSSAERPRSVPFQAGWYADGLIPFRHPEARTALPDARLTAIPFDLPAGETHGFWIDIHVPKDASPGLYEGTYQVTAGGDTVADVPVQLTVWDFALPDALTLKTHFGLYLSQGEYSRVTGQTIDLHKLYEQANSTIRRHGINPKPPSNLTRPKALGGQYQFTRQQIDALRDYIDRHHVSAINVGKMTPHRDAAALPVMTPDIRRKYLSHLSAYDQLTRKLNRPDTTFFWYLIDEPSGRDLYRFIRNAGAAIQEETDVVKVLITEQPTPENPAWGNLYGSVNIWCPAFKHFEPTSAAARRQAGDTLWIYDALRWWQIDYPLLNYRAPAWMAWHFNIEGLLYWEMTNWKKVDDPWTQPKTYTNRAGLSCNGEGCLLYPAHAVGFAGTVPTIRLKAIRDGIEDYEYLSLLARQGRSAEAREITSRLLRDVAEAPRPFLKFYSDPTLHEQARTEIAGLITERR